MIAVTTSWENGIYEVAISPKTGNVVSRPMFILALNDFDATILRDALSAILEIHGDD